jgi:putative spermidine/putrescine transport system permease protein
VIDSWRTPRRLALLAIGTATVLFLVAPMLVIVPMAFTQGQSLSWPPTGFSTKWFQQMVTDPAWVTGFQNSAVVATLVAILSTVIGTIGALGIVRGRFPGRSVANALILSPLIVPVVIIAIGFFSFYARFKTLPVEMWEQVRQVVDPIVAAVATTLMAVTTALLLLVFVVRRQRPAR